MFQRLYSQGRAFHPAMKNIGVWHHPLSLNTLQMSYIRSLSWGRHPIAHWDMIWGFVLCGWIRELNHNSNNLIFSPHQVGCDQIWEILWDEHWIFVRANCQFQDCSSYTTQHLCRLQALMWQSTRGPWGWLLQLHGLLSEAGWFGFVRK